MIEVSGDAVALVSGDSHSRAASATLSRLRLPPAHLRAVGLAIFAAVALRLLAMCSVPLIPEEAYYWVYSQNPQLSYFDHPPMVAWVIGAGTALFGNIELGVRIGAMALMAGVSLLLYRLARMWFDRTTAIVSAVLVQILPVYFGIGLLAPMDAALCFFWLLCLVGVSAAVRSGRPGGWYLAGAALGGALLSKYSGIFLAAGVFVAVAGHPRWRRQLLTVHPYLAFALAAALFSPVMAWNASHDWASFRFQFIERYAGDRINFAAPLGFLGMQIVVLTPVPLVALGYLARRFVRQWRQRGRASVGRSWSVARAWSGPRVPDRCWFAVASAVPGLAAATWTSLRSSTHINWTAPIYLAVIPAAVALVLALDRLQRRTKPDAPRWIEAISKTAFVSALIGGGIIVYLLVLQPRLHIWTVFGPWQPLAVVVEEQENRLKAESGRPPRIIADGKYRLASVLTFYRMPLDANPRDVVRYTTSQWVFGEQGLGYRFWSNQADWTGADAIYLATADKGVDPIRPWFESVQIVDDERLNGRKGYVVAVCRAMRAMPVSTTTAATTTTTRQAEQE